MSDWVYIDNTYLGLSNMKINASIFWSFFVNGQGWSKNAVAAMLGNIQVESTISPRLWQGREYPADPYTTDKGYGLTQWTPARKLITWCDETGLDYRNGDAQLQRILYEQQNGLQWSTENILNMTWDDFIVSEESPEILARVFVWAYERPENPDILLRQKNARFWYNFLSHPPIWLLFKIKEVYGQ